MTDKQNYKHNSISEMLKAVFGHEGIKYRKRKMTKAQLKRNAEIQKAAYELVSMLEDAHEKTKGSTLRFC